MGDILELATDRRTTDRELNYDRDCIDFGKQLKQRPVLDFVSNVERERAILDSDCVTTLDDYLITTAIADATEATRLTVGGILDADTLFGLFGGWVQAHRDKYIDPTELTRHSDVSGTRKHSLRAVYGDNDFRAPEKMEHEYITVRGDEHRTTHMLCDTEPISFDKTLESHVLYPHLALLREITACPHIDTTTGIREAFSAVSDNNYMADVVLAGSTNPIRDEYDKVDTFMPSAHGENVTLFGMEIHIADWLHDDVAIAIDTSTFAVTALFDWERASLALVGPANLHLDSPALHKFSLGEMRATAITNPGAAAIALPDGIDDHMQYELLADISLMDRWSGAHSHGPDPTRGYEPQHYEEYM